MKHVDHWYWPDGEAHMLDWIANPKNRMVLNGRPSYQGKKQMAVLDHCPLSRRRTMVDAGAHIGLWSFNFMHYFKHIDAFEPVAAHRECFRSNVLPDTGKSQGSITLYPYALGERADHISIRVNPTSSGDSWVKGKGPIEMRTIDSFKIEDVDLIKVDAEGYEEFILRGARETISTWRPVVVVEQKRDMAAKFGLNSLGALAFLKILGYRVVQELGGDYIMVPG